jgi:hypothetical protein
MECSSPATAWPRRDLLSKVWFATGRAAGLVIDGV